MKSQVEKNIYLVELPTGGMDLETGYVNIPKVGVTTATSAKAAVAQYIHKHNNWKPKLIISQLKERQKNRGGLESLTTIVPTVESEDGKRLSRKDRKLFTEMAFAQELAYKAGSEDPGNYLPKARKLLAEANQNRSKY